MKYIKDKSQQNNRLKTNKHTLEDRDLKNNKYTIKTETQNLITKASTQLLCVRTLQHKNTPQLKLQVSKRYFHYDDFH